MGKFDTFFDDAVVNAKAAASAVSKKAVTFYDASKHKLSAAEIRGEINKKLKELGKVTYKSEVHGTDLFAEKELLISEIKELIENLNIINGHIAAIKSQRKCPECEARVPKNSVYCNICGAKLEDASAEQSVMAAEEPAAEAVPKVKEAVAEAKEAVGGAVSEAVEAVEQKAEEVVAPAAEKAEEVKEEVTAAVKEAVETADDPSDDLFV